MAQLLQLKWLQFPIACLNECHSNGAMQLDLEPFELKELQFFRRYASVVRYEWFIRMFSKFVNILVT